MTTNATTPEEYLAGLTRERSRALTRVRDAINRAVPEGYEEAIGYGMIVWQVPLAAYPDTYNKKPLLLAGIADQKNYMSLYLMPMYSNSKFMEMIKSSEKPLKMGKSCINFRYVEELPLAVICNIISQCQMDDYAKKAQDSRRKI